MSDERDDSHRIREWLNATALLTPAQREYLNGNADFESGSAHERTVRSRIRDRVRFGLKDCKRLCNRETFRQDDMQQLFSAVRDEHSITAPISFTLEGRCVRCDDFEQSTPISESTLERIEHDIAFALDAVCCRQGLNASNISVDISVEIDTTAADFQEKDIANLTQRERMILSKSGHKSVEETEYEYRDLGNSPI